MNDASTKEIRRIEEDSLYSAKGHFCASHFWGNLHLYLGGLSAVIAAIAGCSAIGQANTLAGILAIISASLTATLTFINPNEKATNHLTAGNRYNKLRNDSRMMHDIELNSLASQDTIIKKIRELNDQRNKLNQESPQIPRWAFNRARAGIEGGEADYSVDKNENC